METAYDLLLNSLPDDATTVSDDNGVCVIDPVSRQIVVPGTLVIGGVESDKNSERIKFSCPKVVGDNLDLSKFQIRINYQNISDKIPIVSVKDQYICEDVKVDGQNITFSWVLSRNATKYKGILRFIVCAVSVNSDSEILVEWNTTLAQIEVLEGIEIEQAQPTETQKDVIAQLLKITKDTSAKAVSDVNTAKNEALKEIESAKTLPRLDEDGVLMF